MLRNFTQTTAAKEYHLLRQGKTNDDVYCDALVSAYIFAFQWIKCNEAPTKQIVLVVGFAPSKPPSLSEEPITDQGFLPITPQPLNANNYCCGDHGMNEWALVMNILYVEIFGVCLAIKMENLFYKILFLQIITVIYFFINF